MKKKSFLLILLAVIAVASAVFGVSCAKNEEKPEEKTYIIRFVTNGADPIPDQTLKAGEKIAVPADPTLDYFEFGGWYDASYTVKYPFGLMPASDITVYALWNPKISVKVQFDSRGGTKVADASVLMGEKLEKPADPTRPGYTFVKWVDADGNEFDFGAALTKDAAVYAEWALSEDYALVSYYVGDKLVSEVPVQKNTAAEPYETDENYTREAWYTEPTMVNRYDFSKPVTDHLALYTQLYSEGLRIENGKVVGYNGSMENVLIPSYFDGAAVTGIADSAFMNNKIVRSVQLPSSIETIGNNAFYNCWYLASIDLGKNVKSIGNYAFYLCENLRSAGTIEGVSAISKSAFSGCKLLSEIKMSDKVTAVGEFAFNDCASLTELYLSENIKSIGRCAFAGCKNLISLQLPSGLESLADNVFQNCYSLKNVSITGNSRYYTSDGNLCSRTGEFIMYFVGEKTDTTFTLGRNLTTIKSNAFLNNSNIKKLIVPSTVKTVECGAFNGMKALEELEICFLGDGSANGYLSYMFGAESAVANGSNSIYVPESLRKVTIDPGLQTLADYAFYGCSSVTEIVGIENLKAIGAHAFSFCGLEEINVTAAVEDLDYEMFEGCRNLSAINIAAGNVFFQSVGGVVYSKNGAALEIVPAGLTALEIPASVRTIKANAFRYSAVEKLTIPETVTTLELGALRGMQRIDTLITPYIGDGGDINNYMIYAFGSTILQTEKDGKVTTTISSNSNYPTTLKNIRISKPFTGLPKFAFLGCTQLSDISFAEGTSYTAIPDFCFHGTAIDRLYITDDVVSVGQFAYAYCTKLVDVFIPGNVKTLDDYSFSYSRNIKKVTFGEGVETIGQYSFIAELSTQNYFTLVAYSNLQEIVFSSTVKSIQKHAFAYTGTTFDSTTSTNKPVDSYIISFPNGCGIEVIEESAFLSSGIAGTINFGASVRVIGESAFESCVSLDTIIFGDEVNGSNLESVGGTSFAFCTKLRNITFYIYPDTVESVPELIPYVYNGVSYGQISYDCPSCNIFVPEESLEKIMKAEYWRDLKNVYPIQP